MRLKSSASESEQTKQQAGFTLLELLVVMVIMGIMLGAVSLNTMQGVHQRLQTEAQRISLLLEMAREEAIVRNRQTAFEASSKSYWFMVLNENKWERLSDLESLREREFNFPEIQLAIEPSPENTESQLRIIFGREPVSRPFVMSLRVGEDKVSINADGVGHFVVE